MPKRKSRSVCSGSPRKSPRKSGGGCTRGSRTPIADVSDEEKGRPEDVTFEFQEDGELLEYVHTNPLDRLTCLDKEDNVNENQVPSKVKLEGESLPNRSSLQSVSTIIASPLKRASPLSPTLFGNVRESQASDPVPSSDCNDTGVKTEGESLPVTPSGTGDEGDMQNEKIIPIPNGPRTPSIQDPQVEAEPVKSAEILVTPSEDQNTNAIETPQKISDTTKPQTLTNVGGNESSVELPMAVFHINESYNPPEIPLPMENDQYLKWIPKSKEDLCKEVEYELDELDIAWLAAINKRRVNFHGLDLGPVRDEEMEVLLDRLEKEHYYELQNNGMGKPEESDEDAVCCVCLDGESDNTNQIIFCDLCNIPVHQECYGVPFIPEGSWLCRRCLISPNDEVECIFCPNKNGAMKQTVDGRWAHVLCALWIPEVRFSNPSLVEPVDDICDIPQARWKLICFLCKKKGIGACIQCHIRSCVTAFHLSCAQNAGLSLKLETKETKTNRTCNSSVSMKAWCDKHTSDVVRKQLTDKINTVHKVLNEKRSDELVKQFPSIPESRVKAVSELVEFPGKTAFVKRLYAYWKLKRRCRGGAPLLQNLEAMWISTENYPPNCSSLCRTEDELDLNLVKTGYTHMQNMQNDLKTFLEFCNMIKNHSLADRDDVELQCKILDIKMQHINPLYVEAIRQLTEKDKNEVFTEPVTDEDAPEYSNIISNPMDLSTMRDKAFRLEYSSLEELEADFTLMINNCMTYNKKSTVFYKSALTMRDEGEKVFAQTRLEQKKEDELREFEEKMENERRDYLERLHITLFDIVNELEVYDDYEIFKEPVNPDEVPEYNNIIKEPMDFSTMRKKIDEKKYSSVEDLEADFKLMINNCLLFNDNKTQYYKIGKKMEQKGEIAFLKAKSTRPACFSRCSIGSLSEDNNNNDEEGSDLELSSLSLEDKLQADQRTSQDFLLEIMTDTFNLLIAEDDEGVFLEPVDTDELPDYANVISNPMDFSLIQKKLKASEYPTLEDMEKDYNLMINNCKVYNGRTSEYYGIAVDMKKVGDMIFRKAKKLLRSKLRKI